MEPFRLDQIDKPLIPSKTLRWAMCIGVLVVLSFLGFDSFLKTGLLPLPDDFWTYILGGSLSVTFALIRRRTRSPLIVEMDKHGSHSCLYDTPGYLMSNHPPLLEVDIAWDVIRRIELHPTRIRFEMHDGQMETIYIGQMLYAQVREVKQALAGFATIRTFPSQP